MGKLQILMQMILFIGFQKLKILTQKFLFFIQE